MKTTPGLVSVVIPTLNEGAMLHMTVDSILQETTHPSYEIVLVDDGSDDGSCDRYERAEGPIRLVRSERQGVARARNLGVTHAAGEYVVFLDAHCRVSPDWLDRFVSALAEPDVGLVGPSFTRLHEPEPKGCGMTWLDHRLETTWFEPVDREGTYEVPLTPGGCQGFRTDVFRALGGYEEGFWRWGFEDVEICLRAWLMGLRVKVDPRIVIAHHFRESRAYVVDDVDVVYNFVRLIHLHFSPPRIRRFLRAIDGSANAKPALDALYESDVFHARQRLESARARDDGWFLQTFTPHLA